MRQVFLLFSELMVRERRQVYKDLASRSKFTESGKDITDSRAEMMEMLGIPTVTIEYDPEERAYASSAKLAMFQSEGLLELG